MAELVKIEFKLVALATEQQIQALNDKTDHNFIPEKYRGVFQRDLDGLEGNERAATFVEKALIGIIMMSLGNQPVVYEHEVTKVTV